MLLLKYETLNRSHEDCIKNFVCLEEPTVQAFLQEFALDLQLQELAVTRLAFDEGQFVGFFTLLNDHTNVTLDHRIILGMDGLPQDRIWFPSVNLHYLGVDSRLQRLGYGSEILAEVCATCLDIAKLSGCTFINILALEDSVGFYEKFGFKSKTPGSHVYEQMILKLSEIVQTPVVETLSV